MDSELPSPEPMTKEELLDELEDSMDDVGKIKNRYMSKILNDDEEFNSSQVPVDTVTKREVESLIESIPKPMVQKPIQPGSSPTDEEKRFLCWNNTGIIRGEFGTEDQSIDVMFHDTEKHASVNFRNEPNYTFGSMSEDAIVLGSNGRYGTGPASIHGLNLLESNRDDREWEVELPHVELIEALTCGLGFVAIITDQRNLRLFTNGGMQSYVFTLPGQVLCMTASDRQLMIIYHNGAGHSDDQNLSMFVYFIDLFSNTISLVHNNVPVSLSKRSPLSWAGFSDEGTPCTYDYNGTVRMFRQEIGKSWVPILDLRELTSSALDHYFVVGVCEMTQSVRAVKCKHSRFPDFSTETAECISFSLPLCDMDTDKGKLEEEYVRLRLAELSYKKLSQVDSIRTMANSSNEANEKLLVNTILRLFAMYLKEDKEEIARSLIYMIPKDFMSKLPEFAWKTKRRQHFIDSLNEAMEQREQLERQVNLQAKNQNDFDDILSQHDFGKELNRARQINNNNNCNNNSDDVHLKPIPLDKSRQNTVNLDKNSRVHNLDDESGDENDCKKAKRIKTINYNLFSKKRPKN